MDEHSAIRRRRVCPDCAGRFTTIERVQLRELVVLKRSGRRTQFDRDKLARSIEVAMRKRPVPQERVERLINGVVRQLESQSEGEISSEEIGALVMERLRLLDAVAYMRFASVYKNFTQASEFALLIEDLNADPEAAASADSDDSTTPAASAAREHE